MDEAYFDNGLGGNFETSTLEITKEHNIDECNNQNSASSSKVIKKNTESEGHTLTQVTFSKDISSINLKHIDIHSFFSDRNEVVQRALKDCQESLLNEGENEIIGNWLLTEISLWDIEKERLVILTKKAIYSIKYDFISLQILEYNRVPLSQLDTLIAGELVYPASSLAPRLNGFAEGVSSIIHSAVRQQWSSLISNAGLAQFEPRKRHMSGVRLMWNKGNALPLSKKWNPFTKDIPWLTYASHPLYWHKASEAERVLFNVDDFYTFIKDLLSTKCSIKSGLIIIENYFGVGALVHNRNELGFFKIRGKVSF